MSDDAANNLVHFNVIPPQGFITAPGANGSTPTIINYTVSLSSVGTTPAVGCNVITYKSDGTEGIPPGGAIVFTNDKASFSGTTYTSGTVTGNFLEVESCYGATSTGVAVASSVDISFTVGVDTYKGTYADGNIGN